MTAEPTHSGSLAIRQGVGAGTSITFDPFGYAEVRRVERALVGEYRALVERALAGLSAATHERVVALAGLLDVIRGYEGIKRAGVRRFREEAAKLGFPAAES